MLAPNNTPKNPRLKSTPTPKFLHPPLGIFYNCQLTSITLRYKINLKCLIKHILYPTLHSLQNQTLGGRIMYLTSTLVSSPHNKGQVSLWHGAPSVRLASTFPLNDFFSKTTTVLVWFHPNFVGSISREWAFRFLQIKGPFKGQKRQILTIF